MPTSRMLELLLECLPRAAVGQTAGKEEDKLVSSFLAGNVSRNGVQSGLQATILWAKVDDRTFVIFDLCQPGRYVHAVTQDRLPGLIGRVTHCYRYSLRQATTRVEWVHSATASFLC
ncbi:hypothetical protein F5Y18DRAFT_217240 [Xylariaceae sp. FL1019]|nr:hypothetical protein F5Y18DRAFT_217240 [Xylariaceae sp. FL1019]